MVEINAFIWRLRRDVITVGLSSSPPLRLFAISG